MKSMKLILNLGTDDAKALGLLPAKAKEGMTVSVDQKVADKLLLNGWAVEPGAETTTADTRSVVVEPPPETAPDFDAMTKEELKVYADQNKVEGVTLVMHKDEMIRLIKKAARTR